MRSVALGYASLGAAPLALPHGSKRPTIRWQRWQDRAPTEAEIRAMFSDVEPANIAIMCGRASKNLLVLDCDTPEAFADIGGGLASAAIETWTVQRPPNGSSHDGGGSYWLRTPVPVKSFSLDGVDGKGQGSYVLAPPSLHPNGGPYTFTKVTDWPFKLPALDTLPWLNLEPAPPPSTRQIPRLARKLLQGNQETINRYRTRSEAAAAICTSLVNAGFSFDDCLGLFLKFPAAGKFAKMHAVDPKNATRWLALTWHSAERFVEDNPSEAKQLAQELGAWALSRPWPGRTGATDRAVYVAHLTIVERCAKDNYGASCRELAELAGVHWDTASKATHRLRHAGLLELVQKATATFSARYHLVPDAVDADSRASSDTLSPPPVRECRTTHTAHDAFRWRGLHKTGSEIWAVLVERGTATETEIQEATGRHRTTIRRRLLQMLNLAMCEPLGDGIWRMLDNVDLDDAAEEMGTAGLGEHQRNTHLKDRALHRLLLERERAQNSRKQRLSDSELTEGQPEPGRPPSVLSVGDRRSLVDTGQRQWGW